MSFLNDTPEKKNYQHLSYEERVLIKHYIDEGFTPYAISNKLGRSRTTIGNEIERGTVEQRKGKKTCTVYLPDAGQAVYQRNRQNCGRKSKLLACAEFIEYADDCILNKQHSPDAIVGAALLNKTFTKENSVCAKTLYNYIDLGLMATKNLDLPLKVKRSGKSNKVRKHKKNLGRSIEERPAEVNDRSEFGNWEIDTVIGKKTKGEPVLMTLTERKTRAEVIRMLQSKTSEEVCRALRELATESGSLFSKVFKSITADNGSEFAELSSLEEELSTKVYFAHPYSSWERGSNECHNGLIRRFIPKGRSLNEFSAKAVLRVQSWCNTLPRKILGYRTPLEAFSAEVMALSS